MVSITNTVPLLAGYIHLADTPWRPPPLAGQAAHGSAAPPLRPRRRQPPSPACLCRSRRALPPAQLAAACRSAPPAAAVAAELGATAPVNFTTLLLMCFRTAPIMHGEPVETRLTRGFQPVQLDSTAGWPDWFKKPAKPGP